ncbi:hypothetical protein LLK53_002639 [Salmonella enterica subsp. enterica serovar Thompson]|nr:hypothetical protein [Salmonella enterica subsp. enterica serovar Thompson]
MIAFTQEELQRIADTDHVQSGDASAIARMLLASLNATPIYQVQYGQQWRDVTKERYEDHRDHGSPTRIVYAEPPAPVEQSPELIDYEHRMICGELRPVPKFRVEETYHNMLKEEQEVNAKLAEYSLNKSLPQPTPESEDRKMLKRLAVIMSGSDSGGEISALTVTAQSLVDRCKTLAREKENSHLQWKPASPDEINKRSVRVPVIGWVRADYQSDNRLEPNTPLFMLGSDDPSETLGLKYIPLSGNSSTTLDGLNIRAVAALRAAVRNQWLKSDNFADKVYWKSMHSIANEIVEAMMQNEPPQPSDNHIPSREAIIAGGVLVQCPRCDGDSYRLKFNGWNHYWCDKCANAITSEDK